MSRVMVHETVLAWHENVERERAFVEEMDSELAVASYIYADFD